MIHEVLVACVRCHRAEMYHEPALEQLCIFGIKFMGAFRRKILSCAIDKTNIDLAECQKLEQVLRCYKKHRGFIEEVCLAAQNNTLSLEVAMNYMQTHDKEIKQREAFFFRQEFALAFLEWYQNNHRDDELVAGMLAKLSPDEKAVAEDIIKTIGNIIKNEKKS